MRELLIIPPEGDCENRICKGTLEEMQAIVGGLIQQVPHFHSFGGRRCTAWCNEEGLILGLPFNPRASEYCGQRLVGTVFFSRPYRKR